MTDSSFYVGRGKGLATVALALLVALFLVVPTASAQGTNGSRLTLEKMAPQDIFAYISCAGFKNCSQAAKDLGLFKIWQEPEFQEFAKKLVAEYNQAATRVPPEILAEWDQGKAMLGGRLSLILGGLTIAWNRDEPIFLPGAVLALDLGDKPEAFRNYLDGLLQRAADEGGFRGCVRADFEYKGHQVQVLKQERYSPQLSICGVYVDNLYLVGLNRHLLCRCLDSLAGTGGSLATLPAFVRGRTKGVANPLLEVFINVNGFTSRVRGLLPDDWLAVPGILGLDSINGLYYSSAVKDGDSFDTMYLDAPGPRRGLLNLFSKPITPATLAFVPKDAAYFEVGNMDLAPCWDAVWQALASVAPPREFVKMKKGLAQVEKELGMAVRDGVLGAFGQEWIVYGELPRQSVFPNLVMAVEVKDKAKADKLLRLIFGAARIRVRAIPYKGQELFVLSLPDDAPFAPTYAFHEGRLIVSLTPLALKAVLRGRSAEAGSILDNPRFKETFAGLPLQGAMGMRFLDVNRAAAYGYNLAENLLPAVKMGPNFPLDLTMLPAAEVVLKHLHGFGDLVASDQDGLVMRGRSLSLASILALGSRFIYESPGIPFIALEQMGRQGFGRQRRGATKTPDIVNPLAPGDPAEAEQRQQEKQLSKLIAAAPDKGNLLFARGHVRHRLRNFKGSIQDFVTAYELGYNKGVAAYNVACCFSLLDQKTEAFAWLELAFKGGYKAAGITRDSDMTNILKDPRLPALLKKYGIK